MRKRSFEVTRGTRLRCRGWRQEGLLRMLENVLAVGEDPDNLVVYAALARAARDWPSHQRIVETLRDMREGETLLVQSGKPIGLLATHARAPLVIMANCNLVGQWARAEVFYELQKRNLICWGGLTAGDWQYIGSQGVIQGTYEIFARIAERHFGGELAGRFILTAGLGGMGGSQPLAGRMANAAILCVEVDPERIQRRLDSGYLERRAANLDEALHAIQTAKSEKRAVSVGLLGNAAEVYPAILARGVVPDIVTDQTSAHDLVYGYVPAGLSLEEVRRLRRTDRQRLMEAGTRSVAAHVRAMLGFQKAGAVVFDNGNLIRSQAKKGGVEEAFDIPVFSEAFLRPLFCRGIGPFRWVALGGEPADIARIDDLVLELFPQNRVAANWIRLARAQVTFQGLPARICWLGYKERHKLGLAFNEMVRNGELKAPIVIGRDHLDSGSVASPNRETEAMLDGSDAIAGVVNVILDTDLEGIKAQVDYGQTTEGDGGDTHAAPDRAGGTTHHRASRRLGRGG